MTPIVKINILTLIIRIDSIPLISIKQLIMTGSDAVITSSTDGYSGWYAFLQKDKKMLLWNVSGNVCKQSKQMLLRTVHQCCRVCQRRGWRWSAVCCLLDNNETSAAGGPPHPRSYHSRKPLWSSVYSTPQLQPPWDPSARYTPLRASTHCLQFNWI